MLDDRDTGVLDRLCSLRKALRCSENRDLSQKKGERRLQIYCSYVVVVVVVFCCCCFLFFCFWGGWIVGVGGDSFPVL